MKIKDNTMAKYHYEWAAYTDNLNWGRTLICRDRSYNYVAMMARSANKGCYMIVKERVYETRNQC